MTEDEEKEPRQVGWDFGDLAVIGMAFIMLIGMLYLLVGPSPVGALFAKRPAEPVFNEVTVGLPEAKPLPQSP